MGDDDCPTRRVSYAQLKIMVDFMGQNTDFATGSLRTMEARHMSKKLWEEVAVLLNNCGIMKTADGWSRYWSVFKNKLKTKVRILEKQKCGQSLDKNINPLTKLEKRALVILGSDFGKTIMKTDVYVDTASNGVSPVVKKEDFEQNMDFDKSQNDSSDRLSGEERDDESDQSSNGDYEDEAVFKSSPYPKWLIDVEKKRAEAELTRAKAEESRARASTKSAEAALIQAEAMKKLAEAVTSQANALMRIASVLENKGQTDDVRSVSSVASLPGYSI